jgi:hypothetical protein
MGRGNWDWKSWSGLALLFLAASAAHGYLSADVSTFRCPSESPFAEATEQSRAPATSSLNGSVIHTNPLVRKTSEPAIGVGAVSHASHAIFDYFDNSAANLGRNFVVAPVAVTVGNFVGYPARYWLWQLERCEKPGWPVHS